MQHKTNRRSYGTGCLITTKRADGTRALLRQVPRPDRAAGQTDDRTGPHTPPSRTGSPSRMAEARLRDLIATVEASAPVEHARTLDAAADAWIAHLAATGRQGVHRPRVPGGAATSGSCRSSAVGRWTGSPNPTSST